MSEKQKILAKSGVSLRLQPEMIVLLVVIFFCIANMSQPPYITTENWWMLIPLVVSILALIWIQIAATFRDRLIVTEDGLVWWHYGFQHKSSWQGMSHFGWPALGHRWGIHTYDERFIPIEFYQDVATYEDRVTPIEPYRRVPLISYRYRIKDLNEFANSEIGAYLYQYAPHLFDESAEEKQKKQS